MSTPLVSILVPCFNAAPWLAPTLESALAQTWPKKEIIVVDDGSTDRSLEVARTFESRGVRVLSQSNSGASAARNRAIREARGEFFQFLDADDLLSPEKIADQLATLAGHGPNALATCRWGRFDGNPTDVRFVDEAVFRDLSAIDYLLLHTRDACMIHPAAWLVPRQVAERAGPWDERLSLNDDGEYFTRVILASAGLVFSPPPAATFYRSNVAGSLSRRRSARALASLFLSVELTSSHLLAAEDSARTRAALADYWQRLVYELYPEDIVAARRAEARVRELGGSTAAPPWGARRKLLSRFLGWRLVSRLFSRPG